MLGSFRFLNLFASVIGVKVLNNLHHPYRFDRVNANEPNVGAQ